MFGYAPYWALASGSTLANGDLSDLQYDKLSTIAYFGLTLDSNGQFMGDAGMTGYHSQQFTTLINVAHSHGVRVVLTAKTFWNPDIYSIVSKSGPAQNAISAIIGAVKQKSLDGVNIDFEGGTGSGYPNIQQDFTSWVHGLSSQLHQQVPGAYMTVSTYSGAASWNDGFMRIDALAPSVDAFFVMAYDMGLSNASSQGLAGTLPNAPLAGGYTYTDTTTADQYLQKTGDGNKVILGVPYYGYKFSTYGTRFNAAVDNNTSGCASACADPYNTILSEFACAQQLQHNWDSASATPWATWWSPPSGDPCGANHGTYRELYYDDINSLGAKYDLVNRRNLRGAGIWALGYDHGTIDLWSAIAAKFEGPCHTAGDQSVIKISHPSQQVAVLGLDCALWVHEQGTNGFTTLGGQLVAAPAVVATGSSTGPFYVATGIDRNLYIRSDSASWQALDTGGSVACLDNPSAAIVSGTLWVACQGIDQALYVGHGPASGSPLPQLASSSWQYLGGQLLNGPAVAVAGGQPILFALGVDHRVYTRTMSTGYVGEPWSCDGSLAAALSGSTTYFACRGLDGALWKASGGANWGPLLSLGGSLIGGPGIAAGPSGPTYYAEGVDGSVWERTASAGWTSDQGAARRGVGGAYIP